MEEETGCKLRALLFKYNAYNWFLMNDVRNSVDIIKDIVEQEINDRNFNQYCLINAINVTIGGSEWLNFKDTLLKNSNIKIDKKEIQRLKEKQINMLNKLL